MRKKRDFSDNTRKEKNLKRKKLILIGAEGSNVTESNYFKNFSTNDIKIKMANGNSTDPVGMVKNIIRTIQHKGIDTQDLDTSVYCVLDTDADYNRFEEIKAAILLAAKEGIRIITSTPCFEDWFLCHFEMTSAFMNNKVVIERLKKYINNYEKKMDVYPIIYRLTQTAVENAKRQCSYHSELGKDSGLEICNPSTEVYKIIDDIKGVRE